MDTVSGSPSASRSRTGQLRPDKHAAIMVGGRKVLAASGIDNASIEAIAAAARVSTRTIYKHFTDKAALCAAVIANSAAQIADDETVLIEEQLSGVDAAGDVEPALQSFASAWLAASAPSAEHRILISQVHSAAAQLDPSLVEVWWGAGPGQVLEKLAAVFGRWREKGLLRAEDPMITAVHYAQLVASQAGPPGRADITTEEKAMWIEAGVRTFVRAYRP
ncbi:TetR/AcrR family transcriptional regulator [Brevibacterium antiquum]|uniref:TetR/AcrR family transcriptional regulator C-terminal domain-containing protein n=1 Tax=Brevibacterium antiquum TaxID=234835 RepID=UPI0018E046D4|nr:TetR/AcrR family transcriptional regulator C-terminal domain-containing protein [Brevibacterium antiquum]